MPNSLHLPPHAVCWASSPVFIWTMVVTNSVTFLSYATISLTLLYLARRTRRVIARDWAYFVAGFALFILACGSTHLLEVVITWWPVFWVDAWANILTAVLSAYIAVMLMVRAHHIAFGVNDYAQRLKNTESEQLRLRESLLSAQKIEEWSRMSATVSHEIRGPLEAIQNLLYLIRESKDVSTQIAQFASSASEEATRVLTIADATLSLIRQGTTPEPIDICSAMDSVRFLLDPLIRKKGIVFDFESKGNCVVEAFAGEVRQVLLNIVRNACEAIQQAGSRVTVTINGEGPDVEIVVLDGGSGIEPDVLSRLFEFGMTTKGEQGNGMGLWTVRYILDKHAGQVSVESDLGTGTRFSLRWPRKLGTIAESHARKYA